MCLHQICNGPLFGDYKQKCFTVVKVRHEENGGVDRRGGRDPLGGVVVVVVDIMPVRGGGGRNDGHHYGDFIVVVVAVVGSWLLCTKWSSSKWVGRGGDWYLWRLVVVVVGRVVVGHGSGW